LADLPVLTQMALNIATLVSTVRCRGAGGHIRSGSNPEYFSRSW